MTVSIDAVRGTADVQSAGRWLVISYASVTGDRLLCAGNNLDKAQAVFAEAIKHRPRTRLTIRQRTRVLQ
jgi:hypothetical protein